MQPHPLSLFRTRLSHRYEPGELRAIALKVMEEAFGVPRLDVYADKVRHFSTDEAARLENIVTRLSQGEPVQYVLGQATFAGRTFQVDPGVLIPRPETEELVEWMVADAAQTTPPRTALDVGTGSGCIAVSLACALPRLEVTAWDISDKALSIARANAWRHGAAVCFEQHDLLRHTPDTRRWDLIVSNPPYVCRAEAAGMERHVLDFEPAEALFVPDDEPLLFYRHLALLAATSLNEGGSLYVEINRRFGRETAAVFREAGFSHTELRTDCFGADRMIRIRR